MMSFIGKVKRGEVASSRQNGKGKAGKDWSSFQHRYAERGEPPLKAVIHPSAALMANVTLLSE